MKTRLLLVLSLLSLVSSARAVQFCREDACDFPRAERHSVPAASEARESRPDESKIYMYKLWDGGAFRPCVFQGPCETYDGELRRAAKLMVHEGLSSDDIYSIKNAEGPSKPGEKPVTDWVKAHAKGYYLITREGWKEVAPEDEDYVRQFAAKYERQDIIKMPGHWYVSPSFMRDYEDAASR